MPRPLDFDERLNKDIVYIEVSGQTKPLDNSIYTQVKLNSINVRERKVSLRVISKDNGLISQVIINGMEKGGVKRLCVLGENDLRRVLKKEKRYAELVVGTNGNICSHVSNLGGEYSVELKFAETIIFPV